MACAANLVYVPVNVTEVASHLREWKAPVQPEMERRGDYMTTLYARAWEAVQYKKGMVCAPQTGALFARSTAHHLWTLGR